MLTKEFFEVQVVQVVHFFLSTMSLLLFSPQVSVDPPNLEPDYFHWHLVSETVEEEVSVGKLVVC
jgi:hypothetical protein